LAPPLLFFRWLFYPLFLLLSLVISLVMRISGQKEETLANYFTKKDLEILLRESEKVGTIDPREGEIISRVFRLSKCRVKEVLVPRTEMVTLRSGSDMQKVRETFADTGLSRIPVVGKTLDEIVGVAYAKDLFSRPKQLQEILREVHFVPQTVLCSELLQKMRVKHATFAIALDEFGGTAGLVTLGDIVEELFGEISDEFDVKMTRMKKVSENEWIVSGRTEIGFINKEMNWHLPEGKYETISGMILENLGRIPAEGEKIEIQDYRITILRADRKRLRFVKVVTVLPD
ncbi:MAG TPA: HlyC/CorC family transporter, partial [Bacteroidetes bacterium]|nr:HlyC/CorC family transporter [Bacteroidota bacterium]